MLRINLIKNASRVINNIERKKKHERSRKMNNTYFEKMEQVGRAYEEARELAKAHKEMIIETFGWDSDELKAWYKAEEADKASMPYGPGAWKAYHAYMASLRNNSSEFEMSEFLWDREVKEFVETLKKAGVKGFVYTNKSTAVMENLHELCEAGCELEGLCTITRLEDYYGRDMDIPVKGIRFKVGGAE